VCPGHGAAGRRSSVAWRQSMDDSPRSSTRRRQSDQCHRPGRACPPALRSGFGRSGGTGRRAGLKIRFPSGSVGSIPTFGITRVGRFTSLPQAQDSSGGRAAVTRLLLPAEVPLQATLSVVRPVLQAVAEPFAVADPVCRRLSSARRRRATRRLAADGADPVLLPCLDPHRPLMTAEPARKRLHAPPPPVVHHQHPSSHPGTHPGERRSGQRPSTGLIRFPSRSVGAIPTSGIR
jgi:hypothetical protein